MRMFTTDDDPKDVVNKIDSFINDEQNTDNVLHQISTIMKSVDELEITINNIQDKPYREEMLGYTTMIRNYTVSVLDAFDSMMGD